jgi:formate dehydrogenase iron-sulfur subunit
MELVKLISDNVRKVKLVDPAVFIGCELCEKVCEFVNKEAKAEIYTSNEGINLPLTCMHCSNPVCVKVCPTAAIYEDEDGAILVRVNRCIGCKLCLMVCPFGIPKFDSKRSYIKKCDLCLKRDREGLPPACVEVCPSGAILYGEYNKVVKKFKKKSIDLLKKKKVIENSERI